MFSALVISFFNTNDVLRIFRVLYSSDLLHHQGIYLLKEIGKPPLPLITFDGMHVK